MHLLIHAPFRLSGFIANVIIKERRGEERREERRGEIKYVSDTLPN